MQVNITERVVRSQQMTNEEKGILAMMLLSWFLGGMTFLAVASVLL